MSKRITLEEALDMIKPGSVVMVGGFLGVGTPQRLINGLVKRGVKGLTLICNDTAMPDKGVGKMVVAGQFDKIITSHIGTNKEAGRQMMEGITEVVLVPQGTLIEQIRAGGYGLGGILTKTGLGTEVEKGKQIIEVDGENYLLEKPLKADFALIYADVADEKGNLSYRGATRNFNPVMASAADTTIAESKRTVPLGGIDPNDVVVPAVFVDYILEEEHDG
ncbi:MAG: CoA transferase subunit A [Clostridiales bacterium]|nr:CoA transferase subunit A [Clostridiales bacterium]